MKNREEYINRITVDEELSFDNLIMGMIKLPECGLCSVVASSNEEGYEHVSVAPIKHYLIPSWNDMAYLKNVFWDEEEECYQIMPKKSEYVNIKGNCLHLWKPVGHELRELVTKD